MTTVDPFARVNARREEMLLEWTGKERELLAKIASKKQEVLDLRSDSDKLARNHHLRQANDLKARAELLEGEARRLETVDLRQLRIEQENIRQNRHPTLSALMTAAHLKARSADGERQRAVANALVTARADFEDHVAKLATKRTLELAQALADAATAANADCGSLVKSLLAAECAA